MHFYIIFVPLFDRIIYLHVEYSEGTTFLESKQLKQCQKYLPKEGRSNSSTVLTTQHGENDKKTNW